MRPEMIGVVLKRFETPDEVRVFEKGRLEFASQAKKHIH